jgi:hypothetical protein
VLPFLIQRRRLIPEPAARSYLTRLFRWCIAPLDAQTTAKAWAVQDEAGLAWWDALLAASALMAGCKLFISEDMQDGQLISGMRIVNPFSTDLLKRVFIEARTGAIGQTSPWVSNAASLVCPTSANRRSSTR